jgi:hypothetical protein
MLLKFDNGSCANICRNLAVWVDIQQQRIEDTTTYTRFVAQLNLTRKECIQQRLQGKLNIFYAHYTFVENLTFSDGKRREEKCQRRYSVCTFPIFYLLYIGVIGLFSDALFRHRSPTSSSVLTYRTFQCQNLTNAKRTFDWVQTYEMMKNAVSGMLRRVVLVRTDVSEEPSASIIRVTRLCM